MAGMQDSSVPPAPEQARRSPGRFATWPVDLALAFALTLLALAGASLERSPLSAPALLLATGPLMTRRRWPLASLAAQLVGVALLGPVNQSPPAILGALAIGGYTATGVGGRRPRLLAGAGAVTVVFVIHFSTRNGAVFLLLSVWLSAAAVREALIGGRGLLGLRERVALYGGELLAGPRHDGGFALSVRLPIEAL